MADELEIKLAELAYNMAKEDVKSVRVVDRQGVARPLDMGSLEDEFIKSFDKLYTAMNETIKKSRTPATGVSG